MAQCDSVSPYICYFLLFGVGGAGSASFDSTEGNIRLRPEVLRFRI